MRQGAKLTESQFGFMWGGAVVTRLTEGNQDGSVIIRVAGRKKGIDVFISPRGNSVKVSPVDIDRPATTVNGGRT